MFERFTEQARHVIVLAQEEVRTFGHDSIGTEHILLGLLREDDGFAARVFERLEITVERARRDVMRVVGSGKSFGSGQIPFTPPAKRVLELALRESVFLHHKFIGTEHLLLGLLRESDGVAAQLLLEFGADADKLRDQVLQMLATGRKTPPTRVQELLRHASTHALQVAHGEIEPIDLMAALTSDQRAAELLAELGIDIPAVRSAIEARDAAVRMPREVRRPAQQTDADAARTEADVLPVQAGPVPDRMTIWPLDDGRYGLDATFQGASGYERVEWHINALKQDNVEHSFQQELDGGWTVRFGPLKAIDVGAALTAFVR